ncbi:MAG TPA: Na+/H+ antiporter NhaA [Gaiellaceae bacterium]
MSTEDATAGQGAPFTGRTAWARNLETPLRSFLRTETGSAAVLLAAAIAALVWATVDVGSYERVWETTFSVRIGGTSVAHDLRYWLNSGLMTFFFFVVGLEARREFDMGELRERRRVSLPLAAGIGGMVVPVAIYLAFNAGRGSAHGWGVAMSTDTAFALGMLALVGPRFPARLRAFMLTVCVVDDLVALVVIAVVYSSGLRVFALLVAAAFFAAFVLTARFGLQRGAVVALLGVGGWLALSKSGVDPIVIGLAMGLLTFAAPAARGDLERASELFRLFREQPTPELARSAQLGLSSALSPNERLQQLFHSWTSYAVVPLFALANAGIPISGHFLSAAFSGPIVPGIVIGYVIGKPAGIFATAWLVTALSRGKLRPPVGWVALTGGGAIAGIGFTVSLLIAGLAFHGEQLGEAKLGVLTAALLASVLTWLVFRATSLLPRRLQIRALVGTAETIVDLAVPVDPERDHIRGPEEAPVTIVEYGDFECPFCGQAEPVIRELLRDAGDVRYVWRHLPLNDVHPRAGLASEAAEAAADQGAFWELHDLLLERQDALLPDDLVGYANELGLDVARFTSDLEKHAGAARVAEDVDGADLSSVTGTPTFFINGRRHYGAYDIGTLEQAVRAARVRAALPA